MIQFELEKNKVIYLDRILFEGTFPILFTCVDKENQLYYCVCCQNNNLGRRWLISETSIGEIIDLLRNKITSRQLLLQNKHWSVIDNGKGIIPDQDLCIWNEDSKYLPKKDSYLEPEDGEYDEDIQYYQSKKNYVGLITAHFEFSNETNRYTFAYSEIRTELACVNEEYSGIYLYNTKRGIDLSTQSVFKYSALMIAA